MSSKLMVQSGQKSITSIRLIMVCYIVPWCYLGYKIWLRLAIQNLMLFKEFQYCRHGRHLEYWNWMILAILNLQVTSMPPIKFRLSLTYGLVGDMVWRISRWPPWQPLAYWNGTISTILISITTQCLPSSLSSSRFTIRERMWFEDFYDGNHSGHLR